MQRSQRGSRGGGQTMFKRRQNSPSRTEEQEEEAADLRRSIREKLTLLDRLQADYNAKTQSLQ